MKTKVSRVAAISISLVVGCSIVGLLGVVIAFVSDLLAGWAL